MVVTYEGENYPGEVVGTNESYAVVSAMERSGLSGWKWPQEPDKLEYTFEDIIQIIKPPIPSGSRHSQFQFSEEF